ncbi:MAG: proline--tRNA ligase [Bacteroidota bacterium]
MSSQQAVLPNKKEDFSQWYNTLVKKADLIEDSAVRGCMVFKPYGFALWERIQKVLDEAFKRTGHQNAYFPLFIPLSYLSKEAGHVEGFAKESAIVTHYRLRKRADGKIVPDPTAALEEPLVVRPTSETIIWHTYSKWIQSYRDLPLLLNQWANVVRWEMRTRPFLRTAEILWQEGHTAHATAQEAQTHARKMHDLYTDFITQYLAIPHIQGEKSAHERFAGALNTYTMEALMQDGKALQLGTSHFLGQNFSKSFDVRFSDQQGKLQYAWGTSWGVTTRLIGALIMTHSDQKGLLLPPKIAPYQVVIIPLYKKNSPEKKDILTYAENLQKKLQAHNIRTQLDTHDTQSPGWKFTAYELKGIPLRLVIGPRDLAQKQVEVTRRDTQEKESIPQENIVATVQQMLDTIQQNMYSKALAFQESHTTQVDDYEDFKATLNQDIPGFISAHWDGTTETEKKIQEETKATIRCLPQDVSPERATCIYSGKPSTQRVLFAKAY